MNKELITLRAEKRGKEVLHFLYMPDGTEIPKLISTSVTQGTNGKATVIAVFYCNIAESKGEQKQ